LINTTENPNHSQFYVYLSDNLIDIFNSNSKIIIYLALKYGKTHDVQNIIEKVSDNITEFFDTQLGINILLTIFEYHTDNNQSIIKYLTNFEKEL